MQRTYIYVDGFNLYYRALRGTPYRWLDLEEKGSDVNLAAHLLWDGMRDRYDVAVLVTNDTDLVEPVRIVRQELGKPVGLICPAAQVAGSLEAVASFVRHVIPARLHAAQFPAKLPGTTIRKPLSW